MAKINITPEDVEMFSAMSVSPVFFMEKAWGLKPQPCKPEYQVRLTHILTKKFDDWEETRAEITAEWFGDFNTETGEWEWYDFQLGKHLTWQQWLFSVCVEKWKKGEALGHISAVSGRGIGKSRELAMLILWFLFVHPDAQIPCTAPTADQMYDVLWKELSMCIEMMPPNLKKMYLWESQYIRIAESPNSWFARAKTASKENPEALSGVHAPFVMAAVDEASGVPEPIFIAAQGILTSPNVLFVMISNGTRLNGFFFDSHHRDRRMWQNLSFNSEESPIVDHNFVRTMDEKYGRTSDEYRVNVGGTFPKEDALDDKNYVALLAERSVHQIPEGDFEYQSDAILGVDPAGEGDNETAWVIRDAFIAQKLKIEKISTAKSVAQITMTLATKYRVLPENIIVDSFGAGADVAKEIAVATQGRWNIRTVNVGELCDESPDPYDSDVPDKRDLYLNKRSEMYWFMRKWFERGGIIIEDSKMKNQLLSVRFKRNIKGKIQIMPKSEMRKLGILSPDIADAMALTFLVQPIRPLTQEEKERKRMLEDEEEPFDQHAAI